MKNKIRKWRVNYIVEYAEKEDVHLYRSVIDNVLRNVALLRGIDFEIEHDRIAVAFPTHETDNSPKGILFDLAYFRSSQLSKITARDFRRLIDHIFEEQQFVWNARFPFEVCSQVQRALPHYPFPVFGDKFS